MDLAVIPCRFAVALLADPARTPGDRNAHVHGGQFGGTPLRLFFMVRRPGCDAMMLEFDTGQSLPWPGSSAA